MAHPLTLPTAALLALAGIGAGIYLGHSAIAEINPMYFSQPATRFHADLSANRPFESAPPALLPQARDPALGTGCIGCRTYPEEYYPIHEASLDRYSSGFASNADALQPEMAGEQPDPEAARLRQAIQQVELYAQGSSDAAGVAYASAEADPTGEAQREGSAVTE
ncbi:MAG: hypothetical protein M3N39_01970 [Pseudomonadota bacterium]|nr:hypothetical protein [Pseudomonadota bacterium]